MDNQTILEQARDKGGERFITEKALHLSANGKAVDEDDPAGRVVLCGPGGSIPLSLAKELGLLDAPAQPEAVAEQQPEQTEPTEPPASDDEGEEQTRKPEQSEPHPVTGKAVHKGQTQDKAIHKAQDK